LRSSFVSYPGTIVSPAPSSEIREPRYPHVEEMGFLYEIPWSPIPEKIAPPKKIPAIEKMKSKKMTFSPDWNTFILGLGIGLFIGLPVGRAILGAGARAVERRVARY
jgi:hypothetical protein